MKIALYCLAFATLFFSCQKEVSVDLDPVPTPVAVFTFSGSPNTCDVATVAGYYATGTALAATNTVTVQVNVTTVGTYSITTNTVNGYQFSGAGTFTATGIQTVVLTGTGTPVAAQMDAFTPTAGTPGCNFFVTVVTPAPAVFSFSGAPNACTVATVGGTYSLGTTLVAANTVTVQVNVTSFGTYTITTGTVGGMTFSKTGTFATTGIQNVILVGSGTPATAGLNTFTVGTGGCTFGITVIGPAVYTFSGSPNACTVATVAGTYAVGTALAATNTVTVQVNVTTSGSYNITSTQGGMTFSKTGIFAGTGVQTVVLAGTGSPTTSGLNTFTVGAGGCTFGVTVTGPAVFTYSGGPNSCTSAVVAGTYTVGGTLSATTHTVTIEVNVTTAGAYNITTTQGGITFSKSGIFTNTGIQTVVLGGSGIPTTGGNNTFSLGTNGCIFVVPVTMPTGTYSCKIDGVLTSFTDRAQADITDEFFNPAVPYLYLDGYTGPANGGTVPEFQIFINRINNTAITPGTYNVDGLLVANPYMIEIDYKVLNPDLSTTIWNTSTTIIPPANPAFTIIVTSVSGGRAKGTFSGKLTNTLAGGTLFKTITEGVFDLPILP